MKIIIVAAALTDAGRGLTAADWWAAAAAAVALLVGVPLAAVGLRRSRRRHRVTVPGENTPGWGEEL